MRAAVVRGDAAQLEPTQVLAAVAAAVIADHLRRGAWPLLAADDPLERPALLLGGGLVSVEGLLGHAVEVGPGVLGGALRGLGGGGGEQNDGKRN